MPINSSSRLKLLSYYDVWCEPPDASGDEILYFASGRKRLKIKGHSFREFRDVVLPLLDGNHMVEEVEKRVASYFDPEDLRRCLNLLESQNLLEDVSAYPNPSNTDQIPVPQLNFLHTVGGDANDISRRLLRATIAIVGLGGAGAQAALSLAAGKVGRIHCVDSLPVSEADTYFSNLFALEQVSTQRAVAVANSLKTLVPQANITTHTQPLDSDSDVERAIDESDFVICCVDRAQISIVYKLNRVCLKRQVRWTSGIQRGTELVLGPTVHPSESPCYLCYKMRAIACAGNPEDEFAYERFLDRRKQDDSSRHENVVFGANILAGLLGMEALKEVSGSMEGSVVGKILIFDLLSFSATKHAILRKPWCPACFRTEPDTSGAGEL
jgi:molybdopterin-synthase adenylyltransferase